MPARQVSRGPARGNGPRPGRAAPDHRRSRLHEEKARSSAAEALFNLGARYKLTLQLTLMVAAGHAFRGAPQERPRVLFLTGRQLNLPGTFRSGGVPGG